MTLIKQKINRKKDCFLEYKIIDFNFILWDNPYMFNNKKESRNMTNIKYKNWNISLAYDEKQKEYWTIWTKDYLDVVGEYFKSVPLAKKWVDQQENI